jgi:hypothetical protein
MNDQSPPKRVTRARAAAKDAGIKTTQVATAAAKAKLTRSTSTIKRKTRAEDNHEDDEHDPLQEIIEPEPKPTRGRPKKAAQPEATTTHDEPPAPAKATRGRSKKTVGEAPAIAMEPTRATRGRPKKVEVEEESIAVEEPVKRPTRSRAVPVSKTVAPKKSVKFEEPDKENIVPTIAKDNKTKVTDTATGLRAKPVRKPAVAARTTRGRAKSGEEENQQQQRVSPLSPKKATQVATARDLTSDDELATTERAPIRPLMQSPIKPVGTNFGTAQKLDLSTSSTVNRATLPAQQHQEFKNSMMASPARRPPPSPFKESLKSSPQKFSLGASTLQSPFKLSVTGTKTPAVSSPFKASLLASPARRPQSPMKVSEAGSPTRSGNHAPIFAATPKASTFKISRFATPRTLSKSVSRPGMMLPPAAPLAGSDEDNEPRDLSDASVAIDSNMLFSGRLSSIIPREADTAVGPLEETIEEHDEMPLDIEIEPQDAEVSAEQPDTIVVDEMEIESTSPLASPTPQDVKRFAPESFALRETDENPFEDSDSEDELASTYSSVPFAGFRISSSNRALSPTTPAPYLGIPATPKVGTVRSSAQRSNQIGFTPLAKQLSDWMAASPIKLAEAVSARDESLPLSEVQPVTGSEDIASSPIKSTFFDDEMCVREELSEAPENDSLEADVAENFESVELLEEDLALAQEADELSLLEPAEIQALASEDAFQSEEPTPSEASQEYGDENAIPIDPELLSLPITEAPAVLKSSNSATPKRVLSERTFHTVCKVPLKPAADDTPMRPSPKKRSASISRLPAQRPTSQLSRSNTVISYSPNKSTPRKESTSMHVLDVVATPSKGNGPDWSTMGTPARTPRRDLNTALLKGAVVFVDVHTSEGADASVLFTELLTQMGARCVKSWTWSGNGEDGSKIGITHVIFKDGGKRTLEKVREANGVVSCVGVGWVLE